MFTPYIIAQEMSLHLFSVLIAVVCGVAGLILSYYTDIATGPMIVLLASGVFFLTFLKRA